MGVKTIQLTKKIESIEHLKNQQMIIDTNLLLYNYIYAINKSGTVYIDKNGNNINHIYAILNIISLFTNNRIFPIFVFDGSPPECKEIVKKRLIKRKIIQENYERSELPIGEKIQIFANNINLTFKKIKECIEIIELCGYPHVISYEEADSQCIAIAKYFGIPNILSRDKDLLMYNFGNVYCDIINQKKQVAYYNSINILTDYNLKCHDIRQKHNLEPINFTHEHFMLFSICLGTDYIAPNEGNTRIKLAKNVAFELFVKSDLDLNKFIDLCNEYKKESVPLNMAENCQYILDYYKNTLVYNPAYLNIKFKYFNKKKLMNVLNTKYNINTQNITSYIKIIEKGESYFLHLL